ncbi:GntR family transcriptional regulator/MocR family aminotransferase [Paenibacillus sp. PastF-1]|uniref:MocR-like pyridoxine biosynthesis transcription factor PdxR n=2 Tax=Paenibacillus TaxID=44249 RepID=UPI0024050DC4|nr:MULTISPECIES: PLP-dependent aminotransferase family protein [unclassified Paenibacillus]MDF9840844.1 GntR family transcriptional regulator/MocR family aminotransferase [Paenibacillus sp. PastF-2]MDF9847428.1 GntR family transcriptional regulator/MocR family aminotransferase [Paenibacillus sp. PastM-2]MDF9853995.1 GntR family transcriptional regulator/MocR family aminotransferase [Paenibacillus sp. PastF-1]MDH6479267.1 GntR family transcriptional regulator/MocR family aminotransferase [Paenib
MLINPMLSEDRKLPYYIQLYDYFKKEILGGALPAGTRLPSIRVLAGQLNISATPVELAYQQLVSEGFIASRPRSGYAVEPMHMLSSRAAAADADASRPSLPAPRITPRDPQHYLYDFHISKNDFSLFPHKIWRRLFQEQLANPDLLQYGDPQGEPALRGSIAAHLRQFRGLRCTPEQVVIGGDQHLLCTLLCHILPGSNRRLGIEDPGYHLLPAAFARNSYEIIPVPLEEDGLDIEQLRDSGAGAVYISPSHQFPCGMIMSIAKRHALLDWARATGGYIIEDDYDGEFRYHGRPVPSLQGLMENSRVIYMGSFAQSVAPAFCVHYMVLPEELLPAYHNLAKELYLEHSASRLNQIALHYFMERGHFARHLRRMRLLYQKKHDSLLQAIHLYFGEQAAIRGQGAGFHLLLRLNRGGDARLLADTAAAAGIRVTPMSYTWWGQSGAEAHRKDTPEFILGFGAIPEERIGAGIRRLAEVWLG